MLTSGTASCDPVSVTPDTIVHAGAAMARSSQAVAQRYQWQQVRGRGTSRLSQRCIAAGSGCCCCYGLVSIYVSRTPAVFFLPAATQLSLAWALTLGVRVCTCRLSRGEGPKDRSCRDPRPFRPGRILIPDCEVGSLIRDLRCQRGNGLGN